MILFLRNIPSSSTVDDLYNYVTPAITGWLFRKPGIILDARILELYDTKTKSVEYHGLVTVDSTKTGERAIKKLRGKPFKNARIAVREYFIRSWHNDRRDRSKPAVSDLLRRKGERRRHSNQLIVVHDKPNNDPLHDRMKLKEENKDWWQ